MKTHYINCVQFDAKGLPIDLESVEFERLNEKKKDHTRFFAKNGYCLQKLPSHGKATVRENSVRGYFTRIGEAGNSTSKDSCEGPSLFLCNLIINKRYSLKFDFLISCS